MQRVVSLTANIHGEALGQAAAEIDAAIAARRASRRAASRWRCAARSRRSRRPSPGCGSACSLSVVVIFLLLAANFQSFRLAVAVVATIPAVLCGVVLMLLVTGTTLNVQSFMGAIMAIGIAVANAILLVTFAEVSRRRRGARRRTAAARRRRAAACAPC